HRARRQTLGRLMGKRPDRTDAIGRAIRRHLNDDERVLAAVDVQRPGTMEAAQSAGVDGALVGAVDAPFSVTDLPDPMSGPWGRQTAELGIEDRVSKRAIWLHLVVTTSRVLLVRRSRLTRRPREVVAAWPI